MMKENQETLAIDLGTVSKIKNDIFEKFLKEARANESYIVD